MRPLTKFLTTTVLELGLIFAGVAAPQARADKPATPPTAPVATPVVAVPVKAPVKAPVAAAPVIPLHQRDSLPFVEPNSSMAQAYMVNINYILNTGNIHGMDGAPDNNGSIDLGADDSLVEALDTVEQEVTASIKASAPLQDLLKQDHWTREEREVWEEYLSNVVSREIRTIPGLSQYRTAHSPDPKVAAAPKSKQHETFDLNKLSEDIDQDSQDYEFDCKAMSILRGIVMQRIDNNLLPAQQVGSRDYKQALSYFWSGGGFMGVDNSVFGHAYLYTPAGNIVEGTAPEQVNNYMKAARLSTLEKFLRGQPLVTVQGKAYGVQSQGALLNGKIDVSRAQRALTEDYAIYTRDELLACAKVDENMTACEFENGLIIVASKVRIGLAQGYDVSLYQKQNIGAPQEGYALVLHLTTHLPVSNRLAVRMGSDYYDGLQHRNYKLAALFNDATKTITLDMAHGDRGFFGWTYTRDKPLLPPPAVVIPPPPLPASPPSAP